MALEDDSEEEASAVLGAFGAQGVRAAGRPELVIEGVVDDLLGELVETQVAETGVGTHGID